MGADRPPNGAFHARFSPAGDQLVGRFVSVDMPLRAGPRHSAQSLAVTAFGKIDRLIFKKMKSRLVILNFREPSWRKVEIETAQTPKYATSSMYNTYDPVAVIQFFSVRTT